MSADTVSEYALDNASGAAFDPDKIKAARTQEIKYMSKMDVNTFYEIGFGNILSGLIRRIDRSNIVKGIIDPVHIENLAKEII